MRTNLRSILARVERLTAGLGDSYQIEQLIATLMEARNRAARDERNQQRQQDGDRNGDSASTTGASSRFRRGSTPSRRWTGEPSG